MQLNELLSGVVVLMRPQEEIEITSIAVDSVSYTHLDVYKRQGVGYALAGYPAAQKRDHGPDGRYAAAIAQLYGTGRAGGHPQPASPRHCRCQGPVSYTHLDVYKRQGQGAG